MAEIAVLAAILGLPLVYWPSLNDAYGVPKTAALGAAVVVVLVAGFMRLAGTQGRRPRLLVPDALALGLLAWMAVATIMSPWPASSLMGIPPRFEGLLAFIGYAAFYFVGSRGSSSFHRLLAASTSIGASLAGLLAFLETRGWFHPVGSGEFGARAISTLGNPVFLGATTGLALPVTVGLFVLERRPQTRGLCALALVFEATGLYYSFGRGAWLGTAVGLGVLTAGLALNARTRARRIVASTSAALALVVCAFALSAVLLPSTTATGIEHVAQGADLRVGTGATRIIMWRETLDQIRTHPVFGQGPETFLARFARVRPLRLLQIEDYLNYPDRPHNAWLYLAYAGGIPALLLHLSFLASLGYGTVKTIRSSRAGVFTLVAASSLAGCVVANELQAFFGLSLPMYTSIAVAAQGSLAAVTFGRLGPSPPPLRSGGLDPRRVRFAPPRAFVLPAAFLMLIAAMPVAFDAVRRPWADISYVRGMKDPSDDVSHLRRATTLSPRDASYAIALGLAYEKLAADQGDPAFLDKAEQAYRDGQSRMPTHPDLRNSLASLERRRGELDAAVGTYQAILLDDPYNASALYNLAAIFEQNSRAGEATPLLERFLSFAPDDVQARVLLAKSYEDLGDLTTAREAYTRVLALDPANTGAREALDRLTR